MNDSHLATLMKHFPPTDEPIYGEGLTYFGGLSEWDFPADYLTLLKAYGEGRIWDYITLFSPFTPSFYRNSFICRDDHLNYALQYSSWTRGMPDYIDSYVNLYPWAGSDVADTFFWMWTNKEAGEYVVVLHNPKTYTWEIHELTITEFLFQLWSGTLASGSYYPGRLEGDDYFVSARTYSTPDKTPPYSDAIQIIPSKERSNDTGLTQLNSLCPPPSRPVLYDHRIRFSELLPHALPADYSELVDAYGDGTFNDLITLFSPYCLLSERSYFLINQQRLEDLEAEPSYTAPPSFPYTLTELRLWAESDNDDFFYWAWSDQAKGEYTIVVRNLSEEQAWEIHHLTFASFLHQLLSGTLETEMVSLACIDTPPSFTPIYSDYSYLTRR